jgi:glycosyltransferase involved in cell wall biosynthesis/uncharacterized HAD superfamily protein/hypoxanthine phosphoribosyltransferase
LDKSWYKGYKTVNYKTIEDLNKDIKALVPKLPPDLDLIAGVPRSGLLAASLLALYLNLPFTDVDGLCERRVLETGLYRKFGKVFDFSRCKKVLVIDDSINSGASMNKAKSAIQGANLPYEVYYAAVYATSISYEFVDFWCEIVDQPRYFEWNVMHHPDLQRSCVDLDGIICRDPTESENDDGANYRRFLVSAEPLVRPTMEIGWIVTCRLEKYRHLTEEWLKKQSIKYRNLVMMDLPDKKTRLALGSHALFKAEVYESSQAILFIESSFDQAQEIARISRKDVLCKETNQMISGTTQNQRPQADSIPRSAAKVTSEIASGNIPCIKSEKSLSVCFFSHSANLYGGERSLLELVTQLVEDYGVVCSVILPSDGPLKQRLEEVGVSTYIADYSWWYDSKLLPEEQISALCTNSAKSLLYNIKQVITKINPDIVVTNTMVIPWGVITASFLGKPHVWFIREFGEADQSLKPFMPFNVTLDFVKNLSDLILTNSDAVRKALFPNVSNEKVLTIYPYVNIPEIALLQNEGNYFTSTTSIKLIITGPVQEGKGQMDAILAVKELVKRGKDVELIIVGYRITDYAKHLKTIVKEEKLEEHVKFVGFKENPYPIMNQADIVLVCSKNEAFGRVTVEGMLLKKPIIGTNTGGTLELIKDGFNGLLYEPGNYHQLAAKIEYLADHPDDAKRLAENGYEFAKKTFTKSKFGGKVYELLKSLKHKATSQASYPTLTLKGSATLDALLTAAAAKDPKINALITELGSSLATREAQISSLETNLQEKATQIHSLESQIHSLEYYMEHSILLQLVNRYQRIVEKLLRRGTRRRHYYELMLSGIRVILNEGWRSFFRKAWHWLTHRPAVIKKPRYDLPKFNASISKKEADKLVFPVPSEKPEVSIIIPAYNNWRYTLNCLKSIAKNTDGDYEVAVIDDASTDATAEVLSRVKNLNLVTNEQNMGFVESCNRGARASEGKYILFLNNDTMVAKGWLSPLLKIIKKEDVGAVGSKLVYPDRTLQEAGGIIWNDGLALNYGRGDDADKPEYNYVREIDYCSGASLMVKRELFEKIGGFDERFKPGYYEDSDLCFSLREIEYKVMYQPMSVVVHFEDVTCGTDTSVGIKKYQEINKTKFIEKWRDILQKYHYSPSPDHVVLARERCLSKRVLVMDNNVPTYDKDSGSFRMFNLLKILIELGNSVTFIGDNLERTQPYTEELQQLGIEVIYAPYVFSAETYIEKYGRFFDVVILSRVNIARKHLARVKRDCIRAKVIYDTVDLHFLRESRQAGIENNEKLLKQAEKTKATELHLARNSDITFVVSPVEKEILLKEAPLLNIEVISNIHCVTKPQKSFSERKDILFIGSFVHLPNVDAVVYFLKEIFPLIKQRMPDVRFYIVGSNPPKQVLSLQSDAIVVTGYVKDVAPYFDNCKVFVAPLRYGAGVKGKINQSMSYGLPVVTTSIGAEGIELIDGENTLIADEPEEFAEKVAILYEDEKLWNKLSQSSIKNVEQYYSYNVVKAALKEILSMV